MAKTRLVAENTETIQPIIIRELKVTNEILVKEKEVVVKEISMQNGEITFVNSKKSIITFVRPFEKVPQITLTLLDASVTNPYTTAITKTGFSCNFQNNWTGSCTYLAVER